MRFLADHELFIAARPHHVAHVAVPVTRHALALGNPVPIQIEDGLVFHAQIAQSGFFFGLFQSDTRQVSITIGMAAGL